jgi:hypothetical protein
MFFEFERVPLPNQIEKHWSRYLQRPPPPHTHTLTPEEVRPVYTVPVDVSSNWMPLTVPV